MDQPSVTLDEARERAGREVLRLVDELGFDTQAAGWIYMGDDEADDAEWRFYLITPMIDEKGPKWIYERLLKVFAKVGLPEAITPLDIYIAGPGDGMFKLLSKMFEPTEDGLIQIGDLSISDGIVDYPIRYVAFYRVRGGGVRANPRLFAKRVENLLAA